MEVRRPATLRDARDAMRDGGEAGTRLAIVGGGTKAGWGRPVAADRVVETGSLDRLIAHDAADLTARVEAGVPLRRLQESLAAAGQWLAVDPPLGDGAGATVGGVLSTGDGGPRRLRYGTLRDLVIGMTVVLPDGTVARSGGNVIKNVAGYDLGKLFTGAFGTLGLVVEATVRLHPLPKRSTALTVPRLDPSTTTTLVLELMASPLEPAALVYERAPDGPAGTLAVGFEGFDGPVEGQAEALRALLRARGARDVETHEGEAADALWAARRDALDGPPGATTIQVATLPAALGKLDRLVRGRLVDEELEITLTSQAALGLHSLRVTGPTSGHANAVRRIREVARELGGHAVVRRAARPDVLAAVDPWGPPAGGAPGRRLMQRVRDRLDPQRRCNPGRFVVDPTP